MTLQGKPRGLFLAGALLVLMSTGITAVGDTKSDDPTFAITIGVAPNFPMLGDIVTIPVIKTSGLGAIYGFDFLLQFDTTAMTFMGGSPGILFDTSGAFDWEYFKCEPNPGNETNGLINIVGLAEINNGDHHPLETYVPDSTIIFTLEFTVTNDSAFSCTLNPIRFYWQDCSDNALIPDSLGYILAVSNSIYDWVDGYPDISNNNYGLPGIYGVTDSCLIDTSIVRAVNLYNGGFSIHCIDDIDWRGDINCNAIPYEIADFVWFSNYFLVGLNAFGNIAECSRSASDVNYDGHELKLEDLIYLYRVIKGEIPYGAVFPHEYITATFIQDDNEKTISLAYGESLAGINLVFDGEVIPTALVEAEGIIWWYEFADGYTRVLIGPDLSDLSVNSPDFTAEGVFLQYTGSATLIDAGMADYYDHVFLTSIFSGDDTLGVPFAFEIAAIQDTAPGGNVTIPVIKTGGSEDIAGFDFLIGYDTQALTMNDISPGIIFDLPGNYEWEYFDYHLGPFECTDPICPTGLIRAVGMADINNGSHHPLQKYIPDSTVLFTLSATVNAELVGDDISTPVSFFWMDCGDNTVAFGSVGDSLALSRYVYNWEGYLISDPDFGIPGYMGAPDICLEGGPNVPFRFTDFKNGGVGLSATTEMRLIVSIDSTIAKPGDTAVYLGVHLSNPRDTIVGFSILVQTDRPDIAEFGISPSDTIAISVENTLIADWEVIGSQSLAGAHQDVFVAAFANSTPPYTSAIMPQSDGVLLRLILHVHDDVLIPDTGIGIPILINETPVYTGFSDPDGNLIGLDGESYDLLFQDGFVLILNSGNGDANRDGSVNIGDAVFLVNYVFNNGPTPLPEDIGNVNCDNNCDAGDVVYLINHIFKNGPEPCIKH